MDIDWYRSRLLQQLTVLQSLDSTASSAASVVELDQTSVGRLSRMDALQGQAMAKASQQRRKQEVADIEAALGRIDNDDFGYCSACDEIIAEARLKHNPAVLMCLQCASNAEA